MPTVSPIAPNPAVLTWARVESGYDEGRVAKRLSTNVNRIVAWESGERVPTMRQLEDLARFYHRPLGLFFRAQPPKLAPLAAEYRRLPGVTPGKESPELRLAIRQMSNRRETMLELLLELGEATPAFDSVAHLAESPAVVARRLREALDVPVSDQLGWISEWQAWAQWRAAVERIGVLVFQFPSVELTEARGISLLHAPLPVAAINSKEMIPEARGFTLIHEVVHLMLAAGKEELPAAREARSGEDWAKLERFVEETASHVLVPENALRDVVRSEHLPRNGWDIGDVRKLARRFRITPLAMATRLRASGFFDWEAYQSWRRQWDAYVATLKPRGGGFASPVAKTLGRAGRPFTQLVLEALTGNRITSDKAARYLDLRFEHFEKLKGALITRPGSGGANE